MLDSADKELVLPVAWTQQRTAKGAGTHLSKRLFVWMVQHGPMTDKKVVAAVGAQLEPSCMLRRTDRRAPRPGAAVSQATLARLVVTELEGLRDGIIEGAHLLYNGLPVHSLGEGAVFHATCEHLARPCVADAHELLACLTAAAHVNPFTLRCSDLALMQQLECLAVAVQDEMGASCSFWEELRGELAEHRARCPARARVVRHSQCLHRRSRKLLAQAWQTQVCHPSTGPTCAGMLRGTVSRARREWFSKPLCDGRKDGTAAVLRPAAAESRADFDNNAG